MEVPRGVLSMVPPAPRGLGATGRQSMPGGGAVGLAPSKLPLQNEDDLESPKFLPRIASNTASNRGASMPGFTMHKSPLGQDGLGTVGSRLGRDGSGVFAHPNFKGQAGLPEKTAFAEREDFKSPWSFTAADPTSSPPWLSQVMSRLEALECSRGPSTGADPNLAARIKELEDGLSQMQQTQLSLQHHDKSLLKKLLLVEQQVAAVEQRLAAEAKPDAAAAAAAAAGAKGAKAAAKGELAEMKACLAQVAEHDKSLKEQQRQLQSMSAALAKLQKQPSSDGRRKPSDPGIGPGPGRKGVSGGTDGVVDGRLAALETRVGAQEAAAAASGSMVAEASSLAASALDAAHQAQAAASAAAAAAAAATEAIPGEVRQSITAVVSPLMQDSASQLAVLGVRVEAGEQQAQHAAALIGELQGAIDTLQQQAAAAAAAAGAAAAAVPPPPQPAPAAAGASGVEAKILLAIGAKVDKINEQMQRLAKQVDGLATQVDGMDAAAAASGGGPRRLETVHEPGGSGSPQKPAAAAAAAASSEDARAAQQTANQALAASSRSLTQASQALSQAGIANEELARLQAVLAASQERLGQVEELSNQAGSFASMAHQNVAALEQVAKTLVVKIDTLSKEMVVLQAKQNATPALSSAALGPAAQFQGQDGTAGPDPRVPAILVDLRQLAGGLGELAGRISVAERELAMTLPTVARVQALKDLENTLLDKQQQVTQDVEAMKRSMQTSQMQAWQQGQMGAAAGGAMGMGYSTMMANMTAMGMGDTQGHGGGGTGRSLAKANSVVLRRSDSKRVSNPSAMRL